MEHSVLCTIGNFTEEAKGMLEEIGGVTYAESSLDDLTDVTVLVVQLGLNVDKTVIDSAPNLKFIATATTGLDHIDVEYAKSKDIEIISLKDETEFLNSITATAELALGLMIALARNIPGAHRSVLEGKWDREGHRGHSLSGKTLGVIGYGRLGKMMAKYGEALGMNVIFTDPDIDGGVEPEELLKQSDVVSIHVHLTKETENCICADAIRCMKPGALLINTSRGKIVDEEALINALDSGTIAGYATDVLSNEWEFSVENAKSPLIDYAKTHQNVLLTPHIGGTTEEARAATDVFIAKKLRERL